MCLKVGLGHLDISFNDECSYVRLGPEERESTSDLSVRVYLSAIGFISDGNLLELNEVGNVSIFVDTAVKEASSTAISTTPRY